jgi:ABC-type multidrug transport system fused ATPase/permease subunit
VARAPEANAFAKAVGYLNYNPTAKWAALVAGSLTGVVYVALLTLLWLFTDLLVHRGRLPNAHDLTPPQLAGFVDGWSKEPPADRSRLLREVVGVDPAQADRLAAVDLSDPEAREALARSDLDLLWRARLASVLESQVGPGAVQVAGLDQPKYDEADHGILGLVVRAHEERRVLSNVLSPLARWNPWTWSAPSGWSYLLGLLALALTLSLVGALLHVAEREAAARATVEATTRLRRAVYHHTFRLGTLAVRALGPTEAVTVFTRHIEAVHDALFTWLTVVFREPIKFVLLLLFALLINFWLALAFLLFATLVWLVGGQAAAYFRRQGRAATHQAGERLTIMRESLMLMRLVKCYLMEQFNQARVERQLARYAQVQLRRYRGEALYQPLLGFLGLLCILVLLYVAGRAVLMGYLGVAGVVAMATALVSLYSPAERWIASRRILRRGRDAAAQVFRFLERRGEVGQVVGAEFLPPLAQQIEFDNVSLREPGTGRMLLEDVSLAIPAKQRVGLIGADDLEKHALVYLIPRLLDPTAGEIRVDSHNLRWVTLDSLRAQIAAVMQHNLVFHDSVANNIGCGDSAFTLPQIIEAAKVAHAHHFIQKLPQGYETPIGELGHPLTVSEQFRIALARAILRDPALVIIEEPEQALDDDTKALLDDTFNRFLSDRTCIFLPHRISTIRSCDQLFLLHKGRAVASGVHKELLQHNPLYRHLHYIEFNEMAEQV